MNGDDTTAEHGTRQVRSHIRSQVTSITIFHIMGFIFGTGMAIPPATASIVASLWYLLFVMVVLYLAALGSGFEERSRTLEFAFGMWGSLAVVYPIALWYYFSQQIALFPYSTELIP